LERPANGRPVVGPRCCTSRSTVRPSATVFTSVSHSYLRLTATRSTQPAPLSTRPPPTRPGPSPYLVWSQPPRNRSAAWGAADGATVGRPPTGMQLPVPFGTRHLGECTVCQLPRGSRSPATTSDVFGRKSYDDIKSVVSELYRFR
jgi:hypothetical protein